MTVRAYYETVTVNLKSAKWNQKTFRIITEQVMVCFSAGTSQRIITLVARVGMSAYYKKIACYYKAKLFVSFVESCRVRRHVRNTLYS